MEEQGLIVQLGEWELTFPIVEEEPHYNAHGRHTGYTRFYRYEALRCVKVFVNREDAIKPVVKAMCEFLKVDRCRVRDNEERYHKVWYARPRSDGTVDYW